MGRDRDQGTNQLFQLDTKATCFICFKPVVEVGPSGSSTNNGEGVASPGTYSLRNICRHLKLDMEMVRLLIYHGEEDEAQQSGHDDPTPAPEKCIIPPDLKASLCQACGVVATRFSELFRKQELIQMEMGSCMGVVGGLLAEADKDVPLVGEFHRRMTSDINPRSFLCLRTVEELRKEMGEKCMEVAKKYPAPVTEEIDRVARGPLGNSEAIAAGKAPSGSGSRKRRRKVASPIPGSTRTIPACMSIGIAASPPPPLPANPSPPRRLSCNQCGATFKFRETLRAHLEIVHGLVLAQEESSQALVPSRPKKVEGQFCKKRFESSQLQRCHGGFESRVNAASTSTASVQVHSQDQLPQPNYTDVPGAEADDDFVEVDITDMDDELTMTLVAPAPVDDDAEDNVSVFEADSAPWDTFSPGILDDSDPSEESTSSVVITRPRPNSESTGTETSETAPVQEPQPRIPKLGPMPQLIQLALKLPKGKGRRKPKSGTDAEYVFNPQTGRYDCPRCSKNFSTACGCQRHFRAAHLKIRYTCEQCGKTFTSQQSRGYHHQSQHMGIRVKCHLCDATFSHPSDLSSHRQSVHFGKLYACKHCSMRFGTSGARSGHQRRCKEKICHQP